MANETCAGLAPALPIGTTSSLVYEPVWRPADRTLEGQGPTSFQPLTTTVKYLQPGISCRPLHEKLEFSVPIVEGAKSYSFRSKGLEYSVEANYTDMRWPVETGERRMVGNLNMSLSGPTTGQQRYKFQTPVKDAKDACSVATDLFQFGCGTSKQETGMVPWGMYGGRTDCQAGVWILNTYECRDPGHTVSNFTSTLLECVPDNRHGDALLTFGTVDGAPPDVLSLHPRSDDKDRILGINLVELVFYGAAQAIFSGGSASLIPALKYQDGTKPDEYIDFATVYKTLQERYPTFAAQVFRALYFEPGNGTVSGSYPSFGSRLAVQTLTFGLVVAMLAGVAVSCIHLLAALALGGRSGLSEDPAAMSGTIAALRRAPHAAEVMRLCQSEPWPHEVRQRETWWRPWGATLISRSSTAALVAALIVAAEVTFQVSSHGRGVAMAGVVGWSHYAWTYVPAFIINSLALLILCLEFNFRIMQPYLRLASGGPMAARGLRDDHVFGLLPARLMRSLRRPMQLGLALATVSTVFASLSSIVIGDLFAFSGDPGDKGDFSLMQLDTFDPAHAFNWSLAADGPLGTTATEITSFNILGLANFTTDTYAFPRLSLVDPLAGPAGEANRSVRLVVPATRGRLNCTFPDLSATQCSETSISFNGSTRPLPCTMWDMTVPRALRTAACPLGPDYIQQFYLSTFGRHHECYLEPSAFAPGAEAATGDSCNDDMGRAQACFSSRRRPYVGEINPLWDPYHAPPSLSGCPGVVAWGRQDVASCAGTHMSFALCNPYLELVQVEAVFALPDFRVVSARELDMGGGTPRRTMDILAVADVFGHWSAAPFAAAETTGAPSVLPDDGDGQGTARDILSSPFEALTSTGAARLVPPGAVLTRADFVGADDASRQKVLLGLEVLWARMTAQLAAKALRTPAGDAATAPGGGGRGVPVTGALTDYGRRWVVQDEFSTRLLQGLYGAVLLCLVAGFFLSSRAMATLLPIPPTSIGGCVRLLLAAGVLRADGDGRGGGAAAAAAASLEPGTPVEIIREQELMSKGKFNFSVKDLSLSAGESDSASGGGGSGRKGLRGLASWGPKS